jgi:hypothetical protein
MTLSEQNSSFSLLYANKRATPYFFAPDRATPRVFGWFRQCTTAFPRCRAALAQRPLGQIVPSSAVAGYRFRLYRGSPVAPSPGGQKGL